MRPVPPPAPSSESAPTTTPPPVAPAAVAPAAVVPAPIPEADRASAATGGAAPVSFTHRPPKPIGPEALKALREAIKSGKYPTDDAVRAGLERLIRRPE